MKIKNYSESIAMPEGVTVKVEGSTVIISGAKGEISKLFKMPLFDFSAENNALVISCPRFGKQHKSLINTVKAIVTSMAKGVTEGYTYKLKICSSHFPMNVAIKGNKLVVKNLLGEKIPRELVLKEGPKVAVNGDFIEVTGPDKELAGQIAGDIEQLTRITNRDRRIFQDGIYITEKAGKKV